MEKDRRIEDRPMMEMKSILRTEEIDGVSEVILQKKVSLSRVEMRSLGLVAILLEDFFLSIVKTNNETNVF